MWERKNILTTFCRSSAWLPVLPCPPLSPACIKVVSTLPYLAQIKVCTPPCLAQKCAELHTKGAHHCFTLSCPFWTAFDITLHCIVVVWFWLALYCPSVPGLSKKSAAVYLGVMLHPCYPHHPSHIRYPIPQILNSNNFAILSFLTPDLIHIAFFEISYCDILQIFCFGVW